MRMPRALKSSRMHSETWPWHDRSDSTRICDCMQIVARLLASSGSTKPNALPTATTCFNQQHRVKAGAIDKKVGRRQAARGELQGLNSVIILRYFCHGVIDNLYAAAQGFAFEPGDELFVLDVQRDFIGIQPRTVGRAIESLVLGHQRGGIADIIEGRVVAIVAGPPAHAFVARIELQDGNV